MVKMNISHRLIVSILGAYGCALLYSHRAGMSVAIISMVKSKTTTEQFINSSCLTKNVTLEQSKPESGQYEWSESLQGVVLGGAYYAYLITPTVAGRITERFGAKWLTAVGVFGPAVLTVFTPIAAEYHVGLVIFIRILIGACSGCVYSSLFALYANWFPKQERASAIAALAFAGNIGLVIVFPLSGYLCDYGFAGGWPSVFYVTALLHVPWFILWWIFVEDSPTQSRRISQKELDYIRANCGTYGKPNKKVSAPWFSIATSPAVWASTIAKMSAGFGYFLLLNKMPSYLDTVFGIPIHQNGLFNAMINLATAISMIIGGPLSDYFRRKKIITLTRLRKNFEIISLLGPAICIAIVPSVGCDSTAVIALLIVAMFLYGFITGGEWPIIPEFAPNFAGTVFGLANTFAMSMGFITPVIVGVFLDQNPGDRNQWNIVFYITVAVYTIGVLIFELFSSAEPQEWGIILDNSDEKKTENDKKSENDKSDIPNTKV